MRDHLSRISHGLSDQLAPSCKSPGRASAIKITRALRGCAGSRHGNLAPGQQFGPPNRWLRNPSRRRETIFCGCQPQVVAKNHTPENCIRTGPGALYNSTWALRQVVCLVWAITSAIVPGSHWALHRRKPAGFERNQRPNPRRSATNIKVAQLRHALSHSSSRCRL